MTQVPRYMYYGYIPGDIYLHILWLLSTMYHICGYAAGPAAHHTYSIMAKYICYEGIHVGIHTME